MIRTVHHVNLSEKNRHAKNQFDVIPVDVTLTNRIYFYKMEKFSFHLLVFGSNLGEVCVYIYQVDEIMGNTLID